MLGEEFWIERKEELEPSKSIALELKIISLQLKPTYSLPALVCFLSDCVMVLWQTHPNWHGNLIMRSTCVCLPHWEFLQATVLSVFFASTYSLAALVFPPILVLYLGTKGNRHSILFPPGCYPTWLPLSHFILSGESNQNSLCFYSICCCLPGYLTFPFLKCCKLRSEPMATMKGSGSLHCGNW